MNNLNHVIVKGIGDVKAVMPILKSNLDLYSNLMLGNFKGLALARLGAKELLEESGCDLFNSYITLPGNVVVGDPRNKDHNHKIELFIVNDLEQKVFSQLKQRVLSLNSHSTFNASYSFPLVSSLNGSSDSIDFYEFLKKEGRDYMTVISGFQREDLYLNDKKLRQEVMEGLFQGDLKQMSDYLSFFKFMSATNNYLNERYSSEKEGIEFFNSLCDIYDKAIMYCKPAWVPTGISLLEASGFLVNTVGFHSNSLTSSIGGTDSKALLVNKDL